MADKKISDMTALAAGSQATGDLLPVVDISEAAASDKNKKMTMEALFQGIPGNVGIGTSSPVANLEVKSASNTTIQISNEDDSTGTLVFKNVGSTNRQISVNSGAMIFGGSSDEQMRIDNTGNVGIGTASPARVLEIQSGSPIIRLTESAGTYSEISANSSVLSLRADAGDGASGTRIDFQLDGSEAMRITNAGNVGIGTTSPSRPLEVSSSQIGARFTSSSSDSQIEVIDSTGTVVFGSASGTAIVQTGGAERLRIDSSGRLLIGSSTSRAAGYGDNGSLQLEGTSYPQAAINLILNSDNGNGGSLNFAKSRGTSTGSSTIVQNGDILGVINFSGGDGTDIKSAAARIRCVVDGTPGSNDMPGALLFETTADGTVSPLERMRIDSSGNVGIGTASPGTKLEVGGSAAFRTDADVRLTIGSAGSIGSNDSNFIRAATDQLIYNSATASGRHSWEIAGSEKVRIDSSGRVLIGTTTEGIGAADNLTIDDSGDCGITIRSGTSNDGNLYFADTTSGGYRKAGFVSYDHANDSLSLGANTNEAIRIKDNGFVGVGLTNPQTKFVVSDGGAGGIEFQPSSSTCYIQAYNRSTGQYLNLDFYAATHRFRDTSGVIRSNLQATGEFDLYTDTVSRVRTARTSGVTRAFSVLNGASDITTGTAVMHVNADGDLVNDNNSYGAISDSKLKENIVDAASQWDDLKALQVRKYNFKAETGRSTQTQIGVIAQEVETVSPGLVENTPDFDDEGNDLGTVTKTVNYSVLYMKAVGALQEAMNRIETLEAKVAALEAG